MNMGTGMPYTKEKIYEGIKEEICANQYKPTTNRDQTSSPIASSTIRMTCLTQKSIGQCFQEHA